MTTKKTDQDPAPTDPPETDPTPEEDPKVVLKALIRETLDEYAAERATDPVRTKKPVNILDALLGR